MPVRIYDISKKLGLENKEVLSKAKTLGIAAARVASSSLDKITAEFLEEELLKAHPDIAAKFAPAPAVEIPRPVAVEEKIVVITAPPPEVKPAPVEPVTVTATFEPPPAEEVVETEPAEPETAPVAIAEPPPAVVEPPKPKPPPIPAGP